jgi:hypothetical protein
LVPALVVRDEGRRFKILSPRPFFQPLTIDFWFVALVAGGEIEAAKASKINKVIPLVGAHHVIAKPPIAE